MCFTGKNINFKHIYLTYYSKKLISVKYFDLSQLLNQWVMHAANLSKYVSLQYVLIFWSQLQCGKRCTRHHYAMFLRHREADRPRNSPDVGRSVGSCVRSYIQHWCFYCPAITERKYRTGNVGQKGTNGVPLIVTQKPPAKG